MQRLTSFAAEPSTHSLRSSSSRCCISRCLGCCCWRWNTSNVGRTPRSARLLCAAIEATAIEVTDSVRAPTVTPSPILSNASPNG